MFMVVPLWNVTFDITDNQQATLTCTEDELPILVKVLIRSRARGIDIAVHEPFQQDAA